MDLHQQTPHDSPMAQGKIQAALAAYRLMVWPFALLATGAMLGAYGFSGRMTAILVDPIFSNVLLVMFGLGVALNMIVGTAEVSQAASRGKNIPYTSIWLPIKTALLASCLLPVGANGASVLTAGLMWSLQLGAGLLG